MFIRHAFAASLLLVVVTAALAGCQTQNNDARNEDVLSGGACGSCSVSRKYPVSDNVYQFLFPVHQQLTAWAGLYTTEIALPGHPIKIYGREVRGCIGLGPGGVHHIAVTPPDDPSPAELKLHGTTYVDTYAHELTHALHNYEDLTDARFGWFGETVAQLASLHILRATGRARYAAWVLGRFAAERAEISDFDATGRASEWYPHAAAQLAADHELRELNAAIACEMLPHFERDPGLWQSVTFINKWNARNIDFHDYLANWAGALANRGLPSDAPDIVRAILYGGERAGALLPECSRTIGDPAEALRESMADYDREITRERNEVVSGGTGPSSGGGVLEMGTPDKPESKHEIPVAEVTDVEDQVAKQIREAAEQESDPHIREALWEEYRKHTERTSE